MNWPRDNNKYELITNNTIAVSITIIIIGNINKCDMLHDTLDDNCLIVVFTDFIIALWLLISVQSWPTQTRCTLLLQTHYHFRRNGTNFGEGIHNFSFSITQRQRTKWVEMHMCHAMRRLECIAVVLFVSKIQERKKERNGERKMFGKSDRQEGIPGGSSLASRPLPLLPPSPHHHPRQPSTSRVLTAKPWISNS